MGYDLENISAQLSTKSQVKCMHGGTAQLTSTANYTLGNGYKPIKWTDKAAVVGCPLRIGNKPSPCTQLHWVTNNPMYIVNGVPSVTIGCVGVTKNASNSVQGAAIILSVW